MAERQIDFKQQAERLSTAILGASAALDVAETNEERDQLTNDLVLLAQAKNDLEKKFKQQKQKEEKELGKSQEEAKGRLARGEYVEKTVTPMPSMPTSFAAMYQPPRVDKEKTRENLIQETSNALGVPPEQIDVDSGLSFKERFSLAALPTDADRAEFISGKYKEVVPLVIDGKSEVFVRKGDKLVKANEIEDTWGDVVAFGATAATEALPTAAAIGGGILGYPTIVGSAALSTGGYAAVAGVQDMAIRKLFGLDAQPVEVLTRQGTNAAITLPIDMVTAGTSKFLARRMGRPVANEISNSLTNAQNVLSRAGVNVQVPSGAKFGEAAVEAQKVLAQMYPGSKNAARLNKNMEQLGNMVEAWNRGGNPERVSQAGIDRMRGQYNALVNEVAGKDERAKRILSKHFEQQLERLQIPEFPKKPTGELLSKLLRESEEAQIEINKKNYRGFYDSMDQMGVNVSFKDAKRQIVSLLLDAKRTGFKTVDDSGIYSVIGRIDQQRANSVKARKLRKQIQQGKVRLTPKVRDELNNLSASGNFFTFQDIASLKQQLAEAVPEGGAAGKGNTAKNLASQISEGFNKYVDDLADNNGMLDEWQRVNASHAQDRLLYERSSPGAILKQVLGDEKLSPSQIVDTAIADPRNTEDVLRAVSLAKDPQGNSLEPVVREQLQQAYLSQIGLTSRAGVSPNTINYNSEMVEVLWGGNAGKNMIQKMDQLNKSFQAQKLNLDNLSSDDIAMLSGALGQDQTRKAISAIAQKKVAEQEAKRLADDKIFGLALKKRWDKLTNGELASSAISPNISSGSVSKVFNSMPLEERKAFTGDFMYEVLASYSGTGMPMVKAPFIRMPDAKKFLTDTGQIAGQASTQEGRELLKKMKTVLGPEETNRFISAQKMIAASQAAPERINKGEIRTVIGVSGVSAYVAEGLGSFFHNRIMAAAFASNTARPFLDILARDAGSAATEKAYARMLTTLMTTRSGMNALTEQMGNDPAFAEAVSKMLFDIKQSEEEARVEIDGR